jgi:hypothetical protein
MKKIKIAFLLIFFGNIFTYTTAQSANSSWQKLEVLSGDWIGEGAGNPGQGGGGFSFGYDLDKKIMVRKSHSEYPAVGNKPKIIHDDLMIIYSGVTDSVKAVYFDNEGHSINYSIAFLEDKTIQFVSKVDTNMPRFRLTYTFSDTANMSVNFEIASPGNPENFKSYVKGTAHKKK